MAGVPLAAVARHLGHQLISMIMRYAHLQLQIDARAVNATMLYYVQSGDKTDTTSDTGTPNGNPQLAKSS